MNRRKKNFTFFTFVFLFFLCVYYYPSILCSWKKNWKYFFFRFAVERAVNLNFCEKIFMLWLVRGKRKNGFYLSLENVNAFSNRCEFSIWNFFFYLLHVIFVFNVWGGRKSGFGRFYRVEKAWNYLMIFKIFEWPVEACNLPSPF